MGIYDLGYGGFGAFQNNYRINDIPRVDINKPAIPVEEVKEPAQSPKIEIEEINKAPRSTDPNSVSLEFNKGNDYSYIGSTKDIENLDVAKAISVVFSTACTSLISPEVSSCGRVMPIRHGSPRSLSPLATTSPPMSTR